jgi:enediyne biosynthesis protein E4
MLANLLRLLLALCLLAMATIHGRAAQRSSVARDAVAPIFFKLDTADAGLHFQHVNGASPDKYMVETMGSGGLFFNYDRDGWIDIFLVDGGSIADRAVADAARHRLY